MIFVIKIKMMQKCELESKKKNQNIKYKHTILKLEITKLMWKTEKNHFLCINFACVCWFKIFEEKNVPF